MHPSARRAMEHRIDQYLTPGSHQRVLDFGSRVARAGQQTHRDLFEGRNVTYLGTDVEAGPNVDVVMPQPYRIPVATGSVDMVISGQVFEHIPFFWASMLEIARVLKPGGHFIVTVPSRGHHHSTYDCWRYYPDGIRSMAAWAGLELLDARTDFPPALPDTGGRHDYAAIDGPHHYWGDTAGVLRKPTAKYPRMKFAIVRLVVRWWANHVKDLERVPRTTSPVAVAPR